MKKVAGTVLNLLSFFSVSLLISFNIHAATIFVDQTASGANNGTSWADAYTSLSDALAAAVPGDDIWVAMGLYKPETLVDLNGSGGSDPREATFIMPFSANIYGGFDGTESSLEERDWETNLTILSGDIDNNDVNGDGNSIAESTADIVGGNAYHVVYSNDVSSGMLLDGFIITAGSASIAAPVDQFDPNLDGGGWYNRLAGGWNSSSPNIYNTTFRGNFAESEGGAMYNVGTPNGQIISTFRNTQFIQNKADVAGGAILLGSFSMGEYEPHFIKCRFEMNEAFLRGGALTLIGDRAEFDSCYFTGNFVTAISPDFSTLPGAGGAANLVASNAVFTSCIFTENSSTGNPTGPFEGGGGGALSITSNEPQTIELGDSEPMFISCGFYSNTTGGNTAAWGGAIVHRSDAGRLLPQYVNCVFNDNEAQNDGGAVANFLRVMIPPVDFTPALEPSFTNCTFSENSAARGGAMFNDGQEVSGTELLVSRIENTIMWNDSAGMGPEIFSNAENIISYSLIEGSGGSGGGWDNSIGTDAGNNIDEDPGFTNDADPDGADNIPGTLDDGLGLSSSSAAVNEGNNAAAGLAGITTDYTGNNRILFGQVDIGAYERCGEIDEDGDVFSLTDWKDKHKSWSFLLLKSFSTSVFHGKVNGFEEQAQLLQKEDGEFDKTSFFPQFILPSELRWDGEAQLINYGDSALVVGKLKDAHKKNIGFNVYIKLVNPKTWAQWKANKGIYAAYSIKALITAAKEHQSWTYWELSNKSYFEGTGDVSGKLMLKHFANHKTAFQVGKGANGLDSDFGIGGLFTYEGSVTIKGKSSLIKGIGSLNSDADKCDSCDPLVKREAGEALAAEIIELPTSYSLAQNFPNPFNPSTTFEYKLADAGSVVLKIYDVLGKEVATLVDEVKPAGTYRQEFNASNLASGIYYYRLTANNFTSTKKMLLLK